MDNNSDFDVRGAFLYKVKEGALTLERFGDFSMEILLSLFSTIQMGEVGLVVRALAIPGDLNSLFPEALLLVTREGAYRIKSAGNFYEQVYDGYNFGFLSRKVAFGIVQAVFEGNPDPSYLKYESDAGIPPSYM